MTREELLKALELLSALESWGFSNKLTLPDYLLENLYEVQDAIRKEILK